MFRFKTACRQIWLPCHEVIYYPWSCCVFRNTPQCHSSTFLFDLMVICKVNTSTLQQSCSATSTHPLASHRSNNAASTFSWPSICTVKHYSLYKYWTCVRERYEKTTWHAKESPKLLFVLNENTGQITACYLTGHMVGLTWRKCFSIIFSNPIQ